MHRDIVPDLGRRQLLRTVLSLVGLGAGALVTRAVLGQSTPDTVLADSTPKSTTTTTTTTASPTTSPATTTSPTTTSPSPTTTVEPSTTTTTTSEPVVATTTTTSPPAVETLAVTVFCRDAWGAVAAQGGFESHSVARLTVHHTARMLSDPSGGPNAIRGHQRFHIEDRGWPDLAYHYIVSTDGNAFEGRPEQYRGDTGTSYDPSGHFLVCLEGNFDEQDPTEAQLDTVARLLAYGATKYNVATSTLGGHRDYAATSCPGDATYAQIANGSLESRVEAYVSAGTMTRALWCGPDASAAVGVIEA